MSSIDCIQGAIFLAIWVCSLSLLLSEEKVLENTLLLDELADCINVHEVDYCEDVLSLASRDPLTVREEPASFVLDVMEILHRMGYTILKGLKESPLALGVLR